MDSFKKKQLMQLFNIKNKEQWDYFIQMSTNNTLQCLLSISELAFLFELPYAVGVQGNKDGYEYKIVRDANGNIIQITILKELE